MQKKIIELIFLAACFIAISVACVLIYNGNYGETVFTILGLTIFALFVYILLKMIKKI